jgi:hypothetical protein
VLMYCRSVLDTRFKAPESATISSFRVSCSSSMFLPVKLGPRHVPMDQIRRNMMVTMTMYDLSNSAAMLWTLDRYIA